MFSVYPETENNSNMLYDFIITNSRRNCGNSLSFLCGFLALRFSRCKSKLIFGFEKLHECLQSKTAHMYVCQSINIVLQIQTRMKFLKTNRSVGKLHIRILGQ